MNIYTNSIPKTPRLIIREDYLKLIYAALAVGQLEFARHITLKWLANFPGDLGASFYYAQILFVEKRISHAEYVLKGLCNADPEFIEACELLYQVEELLGDDYEPVNTKPSNIF